MTRDEATARITSILKQYVSAQDDAQFDLLPQAFTAGKVYEAFALALISKALSSNEGVQLTLVNGNYLPLKTAPGPINRRYPHIRLTRAGSVIAEMWTDIEFVSLSHRFRPSGPPTRGEYHELDIAIVDPGLTGRPRHDQVWLGAECKNTGYNKSLLKEVLGVRRELSLLQDDQTTRFQRWPRQMVPAKPASCLLVYSSDPGVVEYARPGEVFGIDFFHEELSL